MSGILLGSMSEIGEPLRVLLKTAERLGHRIVIASDDKDGVTLTAIPAETK